MLTDEEIKNFQVIWKNSFGIEISRESAIEKGIKLLRLFQLIYRPMTIEEYRAVQKTQKNKYK